MTATTSLSAGAASPGASTQETIVLSRGVPAPEALPAEQLAECFAAVVRRDPVGVLQYGHQAGYAPLRKWLAEQRGVGDDQILVSNGSLQLMDLISAHLVNPGDTVLVEQPSYDRAIGTFRRRGARVIGIPLAHDGLDVDRLEAQVSRQVPAFVYVIPDFQNPAGVTLSEAKRRRLADLAARYNFWILEDVPYRSLRYRGESPPSIREMRPERVIQMSSHSKLVAPALRVGHVIAPPALVAVLARLGEDTYLAPVLPAQAMLYEFLQRGWLGPNLEKLKALYAPRLSAMVAAVRRHVPDASFAEPDGGFFLGLTLPPSANTSGLIERAKLRGLLLTDGRSFFADPDSDEPPATERFVRLPFCAVTPEQMDQGLARLAHLIR